MQAIIDFFTSIIDILVSLIQLLWTLIDSILWLTLNSAQLVSGVTAGFAYAPAFLMPFLTASIAILVVFMIIKMF